MHVAECTAFEGPKSAFVYDTAPILLALLCAVFEWPSWLLSVLKIPMIDARDTCTALDWPSWLTRAVRIALHWTV